MLDIEAAYIGHPLNAGSILDRLTRKGKRVGEVTENDLAVDTATEITDQNHVGGIRAAVEAGFLLKAKPHALFLDIGCGLGGTARVLAERFGCRVHGVEVFPARCRDARTLTELVGLQHRVTITCGDFMNVTFAEGGYDGALSQGSIGHFPIIENFFERCSSVLKYQARFVIEDVCLPANPLNSSDQEKLIELQRIWSINILSPERWQASARAAGFECVTGRDLSQRLLAYFSRLVDVSRLMHPPPPPSEIESWKLARDLSAASALRYHRLTVTCLRDPGRY